VRSLEGPHLPSRLVAKAETILRWLSPADGSRCGRWPWPEHGQGQWGIGQYAYVLYWLLSFIGFSPWADSHPVVINHLYRQFTGDIRVYQKNQLQDSEMLFDEPGKVDARLKALRHAVAVLTGATGKGRILDHNLVEKVTLDAARHLHRYTDLGFGNREFIKEVDNWKARFAKGQNSKTASELRVLFLAGPQPSNDIKALIDLGISQFNITAVEKDEKVYSVAKSDLERNGYSVKLNRCSLASHFRIDQTKYDIVYFDATGPFMGGDPNTLAPILELFTHNRLSQYSVLISNYSQVYPDTQAKFSALCAAYFSTRMVDIPHSFASSAVDPALTAYEPTLLLPLVNAKIDEFYSEFITRFTVDLGRFVIPGSRSITTKGARRWIFHPDKDKVDAIIKGIFRPPQTRPLSGNFRQWLTQSLARHTADICPTSYPLYAFLEYSKLLSGSDPVGEVFRNHSVNNVPMRGLLPLIFTLNRIIEGHWDVISDLAKDLSVGVWLDRTGGLFCDVPMPHLVLNALLGVNGLPYHPVPADCLRFKYKSRKTEMYCDCIVFDQCRELYNSLPEPQNFISTLAENYPFQLLVRAMLDRMSWEDWGSATHPFRGAALFGMGERKYSRPTTYPSRETLG